MSTGIMPKVGEEYTQRLLANDLAIITSWSVSLYNDSTDSLLDTSDIGDITTEPTGTSYSRQSVSLSADVTLGVNASDNVYIEVDNQTFDVSDCSQDVDAYFVIVSYQSTVVNSESGANDHILFNGSLNQTINLNNWAEYTAQNIRGVLD